MPPACRVPLDGSPRDIPDSVTTTSSRVVGHRPETRSAMPRTSGSRPSMTRVLKPRRVSPTVTRVRPVLNGSTRASSSRPTAAPTSAAGAAEFDPRSPGRCLAGGGSQLVELAEQVKVISPVALGA